MPRASSRGKFRARRRDHAVDVGDAGAQADQREHVRAAVDQRSPEALKEWEAAPEDDGGGQRELKPGNVKVDYDRAHSEHAVEPVPDHAAHRDREQRRR